MLSLREDKIIDLIVKMGSLERDDASWFSVGKSKIVVNVDAFDSEVHWINTLTYKEIGKRSVIAAFSDVLVKGARPVGGLVSLRAPKFLDERFVEEIFEGIIEGLRIFNAELLGGDTDIVADNVLRLTLVGIGISEDGQIIRRKGASVGEYLLMTGSVGRSSILYDIHEGNARICKTVNIEDSSSNIPPVDNWLSVKGVITSSIDNSDGLALSLYYLAESSNVGIFLEKIPIFSGLLECLSFDDALEKALYSSGEEYNFIFTVPKEYVHMVLSKVENASVIGKIVENRGVYLRNYGRIRREGWIGGD